MPQFQYTARSLNGRLVDGVLAADSRQEVLGLLAKQSLLPVSVGEAKAGRSLQMRRVRGAVLASMFEMLADLLESGVELLKAIDVLIEQTAHPVLKATLEDLRKQVADGRPLADSMKCHPAVFSELSVSIVRAGEEGGFLEDSLKRIADFTEKQEELRGRVLGALAYPLFLLIAGAVVVTGMVVFFVPKFAPLFDRMRAEGTLPTSTILLLGLSDFLRTYGAWLVIVGCGLAFVTRQQMQSEHARRWIDTARLRIRGVGSVVRSLAMARFCRVLGTLLKNGVPMLKSLRIARDATGNVVLSQAIADAADNVSSGKSLSEPLRACGEFPREILEIIAVGEQSNRLETVLLNLADKLEHRTQRRLDVLMKLLEPSLMLVMAVVIGFLVMALLLPVFESSGGIS
jgi:general secretion pathway protein F